MYIFMYNYATWSQNQAIKIYNKQYLTHFEYLWVFDSEMTNKWMISQPTAQLYFCVRWPLTSESSQPGSE